MNKTQILRLKSNLDAWVERVNQPDFIPLDPISIPHSFTKKEDIEISGFLVSLIAWGRRDLIIKSAERMLNIMDYSPYQFVIGGGGNQFQHLAPFVHRTFNREDFMAMLRLLQEIYLNRGGLESVMGKHLDKEGLGAFEAIKSLRWVAEQMADFPIHAFKHLPNPDKGSAAKRLNMFLRWMVRKDEKGVDFGIWKNSLPSKLICPLDVHTGRSARKLNLLRRKANDRQAAEELTQHLCLLDPLDPVKYDFALFGMGIEGNKKTQPQI